MLIDWIQVANQLFTSCLTACFTIVGGVSILLLGQLALRLFIDPINKQAELIGEIAHSLTYYANIYGNSNISDSKDRIEASNTLRRQASQLRASAWTIRWYSLWQTFGFIPRKDDVLKASSNIIGLSNSMNHADYNTIKRWEDEIKLLLRLDL